jgi:hypothetical protein
MNVRFQKTPKGEMAILPRKDYEALVMKAAEADEDAGTRVPLRVLARKLRRAPPCYQRMPPIVWLMVKIRSASCANGGALPKCICLSRLISARAIFPTSRADAVSAHRQRYVLSQRH